MFINSHPQVEGEERYLTAGGWPAIKRGGARAKRGYIERVLMQKEYLGCGKYTMFNRRLRQDIPF
jgi:hypothetical protein